MPTRSEVRQHSTRQSCWVIINGTVYDVTAFVNDHPGGASILLKYAGRDATEAFAPVHQIDTIPRYLTPQQNLGAVSDSDVDETIALPVQSKNKEEKKARLSSIINISDFEYAAIQHLPPTSFAFLKSGAEDEHATTWNRDSWKAIRLRPRILRPIETINIATSILDTSFSAPFFICPAGGAKLAHPDGDLCLTRAAARHGILHWTCSNSSFPLPEMASARAPGQTTYWQIYAAADLAVTEEQVKRAVQLGYKGFALTVDAIWSGKRESDLRANSLLDDDDEDAGEEEEEEDTTFAKEPTVKRPPVWSRFNWVSAITWLRTLTDLPIAIKGIQTWEDAALCMQHPGVHPWLSNHGGRQIDSAPSAAETLVSMHQHCPEVFTKCNVIVDGGITRGADIVKALALGATAVGLGRGFLYSIVFGDAGASKAIRILVHEIETTMALLGITSLQELDSSYVDTSSLVSSYRRAHL